MYVKGETIRRRICHRKAQLFGENILSDVNWNRCCFCVFNLTKCKTINSVQQNQVSCQICRTSFLHQHSWLFVKWVFTPLSTVPSQTRGRFGSRRSCSSLPSQTLSIITESLSLPYWYFTPPSPPTSAQWKQSTHPFLVSSSYVEALLT